jgi:hypothetical protein
METFKDFVEQSEAIESLLNEFNNSSLQNSKVWSGKKKEILQMWKNLRPDIPIIIQPMLDDPTGGDSSSYGEDGIRVTGSWHFISAILARLKEIIGYENPQTKLRLVFRGVGKEKDPRPDRKSFVFYVNLEKRAPKKPKNILPQL